jgi:thiol-disulfide isomerase/thioredoxin
MRLLAHIVLAATLAFSAPALAFEIKPYDAAQVQTAIASGKPVVVHVFAPWCLQCRAQENILKRLSAAGTYDNMAFFRVNYDQQKDAVKALDVPRSTLIAFKGGKETGRMSWGVSEDSVVKVLATAE